MTWKLQRMVKSNPDIDSPTLRVSLTALIVAVVVGILLLASVPPVSRDALTHHLAVPKQYLAQGGMVELPDCEFSYYPMNLELLYLLPLYWGNDIPAKYIHFLFALLAAGLVFFYLKRKIGSTYGLLGVLLFLSLPVIIKLSITVYVDLGLIFFSAAALLAFVNWLESGFSRRYLVLSAVCTGLALGTKYNGLLTFLLLAIFIPFAYSVNNRDTRNRGLKAIAAGIVFVAISLLVFSPWMIRNFNWTGNPIYPLFQSVFQTGVAPDRQDSARPAADRRPRLENHFAFRTHVYGDTPVDIAFIPIRIFFQGRDNDPEYFDGVLNPYLLVLPLAWVCLARRKALNLQAGEVYLLLFAVLYLLFVFFQTHMRIRWITPIVPPLIILAVLGLKQFMAAVKTRRQGFRRNVTATLLVLVIVGLLGMNLRYLALQFKTVAPWAYISGQVNRDDYISRYRPAYRVHAFANRTLPADAVILGMFLGKRRYYSDLEIMFNNSLLKGAIDHLDTAAAVGDALREKGITHLMLRQDLFEKWVRENFGVRELALLKVFFSQKLTLLASSPGYLLYALK